MQIKHFSFNVNGLRVETDNKAIELDPRATCQLLQDLNQIQEFASDANGEPVILQEDPSSPLGYSYMLWCDFVKTFCMLKSQVRVLVAHLDDTASFEKQRAIIAYLSNSKNVA